MELTGLRDLPGWDELRQRYRQALTSASYVVLLFWGLHLGETAGWAVCLTLMVAVAFVAWASTYKRARAVADIATSRIGSAAQGYVELVGRASGAPAELIVTPFTGMACVWYRYRVYSRADGRGEWRQIDSGTSSATFEISDGTGSCRVDPDHAEVLAPDQRVTYRQGDKMIEEMLLSGSMIYVLGELSTLRGPQMASTVRDDVNALLATWKQDPVQLQRRFDLDGNGEIDLHEWEWARRLALRTVERQHREMGDLGEVSLMRAPAGGRLFLISTLSPQKLRRRFLWWSFLHLGVALGGCGLLVWLRLQA